MSDDELLTDDPGDREYLRVLLAAVCLVAVLLAAAALPVLSPAGSGGPLASLVPTPSDVPMSGASAPGSVPGGSGGFGALNPQESTDIGGSLSEPGGNPFRSQSNEVHFTAQSSQPAYWRTGAYDEYTGSGWDSDGPTTPYDGAMAPERGSSEVQYRVTLAKSATALPTVWQPNTVSRDDAVVTDSRALRSTTPLSPGTEFRGTSVRPPDDPALLRESGAGAPEAVDPEYTRVTPESERRLTPFVDELTADDATAYDKAKTIENWLESEKEYSLNASHDEGDIASEFVFDMEKGYCEYFATSMAAMLRTQDIPARYVVGYSTGERTGAGEYTVRGMNAHAWVEVYFPNAGWVRFDPTPAADRRQQEQESLEPPENESTAADDSYDFSLNRTASPGATVTVTVTQGGDTVEGARVFFNGESIGQTDEAGQVVGTIPYEERLEITAEQPTAQSVGVPPSPVRSDDRFFAVRGPYAQQSQPAANQSYELETNASLNVTGTVAPGGEVTVTATVEGVPVRNGAVTVGGERIGTTDSEGRATVRLPDTIDNTTLVVQRGSVIGEVALTGLAIDVRPSLPIALPGTDAIVTATAQEGDPVGGAAVLVDGEQVALTDENGTATVTLPFADSATVAVLTNFQRDEQTVGGLYRNLAGVWAFALVVLGAIGYGAHRRGVTGAVVSDWFRRAGQLVIGALVGLAAAIDTAIGMLRRRLWLTIEHLRDLLAQRVTLGALIESLQAWVADRFSAAETAVDSATNAVAAADPRTDATDESDARTTIRSAWQRFVARVSIRRHRNRTPGEIATHAVEEDGIPREAVATLRDAFRAVEYGQRDPEDRVAAVEQAIERIEADDIEEDR